MQIITIQKSNYKKTTIITTKNILFDIFKKTIWYIVFILLIF